MPSAQPWKPKPQVPNAQAYACDVDQGLYVAHNHPTPEQAAIIDDYAHSYVERFGYAPVGMHAIPIPSAEKPTVALFKGWYERWGAS